MTTLHLPPAAHRAGHWALTHLRRHVPFALYTAGTLAYMGWVLYTMARIG